MRLLFIVIVGVIILGAVLVVNRMAAREMPAAPDEPVDDETSLDARLTEAAMTFRAASNSLSEDRAPLRTALDDLAAQCEALAGREAEGGTFSRVARSAILRLLLALYGVVERVTALAKQGAVDASDPRLISAVGLIVGATDTLHVIADREDETALRHLEADLDVLRQRLEETD